MSRPWHSGWVGEVMAHGIILITHTLFFLGGVFGLCTMIFAIFFPETLLQVFVKR